MGTRFFVRDVCSDCGIDGAQIVAVGEETDAPTLSNALAEMPCEACGSPNQEVLAVDLDLKAQQEAELSSPDPDPNPDPDPSSIP